MMCKEGREHKSHYVPGMNLSPGDWTGAKERACSHGVARLASRSRRSRLDVGLKPPTTWLHHFLGNFKMKHRQLIASGRGSTCLGKEKTIGSGERRVNERNI